MIFEKKRPQIKTDFGIIEDWFTWSHEFRKTFGLIKKLREYQSLVPKLIFIKGFKTYNYSYDITPSSKEVLEVLDILEPFALDLYKIKLENELLCYDGMIDKEISGDDLRVILSIFRKIIVTKFRHKMEALYTPLTDSNKGYFALHCDLYIPKRLFIIYEDVPSDESGASIFLEMKIFKEEVLPSVNKMPEKIRKRIFSILNSIKDKDKYEDFYKLLNNPSNPWFYQLRTLNRGFTKQHKFKKGQGFMLHDRNWLHGRTKPNGIFSEKRLHRFVFNSS